MYFICSTRSVRLCYYCGWYSGNHRWTRILPIGPPCLTSRKMVLFIPRPWYQHCCRHNWHATLWHAFLSWSYKMSAPFLLLTHMVGPQPTVPQDRNLTPPYIFDSEIFLHLASYHVTSHLPRDDLFPMLWTPFSHSVQVSIVVHSLETSYYTFIFALDVLLSFNTRDTSASYPELFTR